MMSFKKIERLVGALYLSSSLGLALFCLFQSHKLGHDQSARDLAGRSIHTGERLPSQQIVPHLIPVTKKIGEESD